MRRVLFAAIVTLAAGAMVSGQDGRVKPPIRGLLSMGAHGFPELPDAQLRRWAQMLEANGNQR
jgi:hypothetical protein